MLIAVYTLQTGHCTQQSELYTENENWMVHTAQYTLTVNTIQWTLLTAHCTSHSEYYTQNNVHCTLKTAHCTLYTEHCTLQTTPCTVHTTHCTIISSPPAASYIAAAAFRENLLFTRPAIDWAVLLTALFIFIFIQYQLHIRLVHGRKNCNYFHCIWGTI